MQNFSAPAAFERGVVQPMVCLRGGYDVIKDQYWLFVGMCFVAILIGSVVPLGIMMGPMMCGLYLAIFQKHRGRQVEFGLIFKGFDYLGESIIATLIHVIPVVVIIVPFYIAFYAAFFRNHGNARRTGSRKYDGLFRHLLCVPDHRDGFDHHHLGAVYFYISIDR